ncbi:MAG: hypothetical protein Q4B60_01175 [Erysipelotrichaceae bacterium]|nr:hypothetical protein [Erysipelotrichaceae bacterium]
MKKMIYKISTVLLSVLLLVGVVAYKESAPLYADINLNVAVQNNSDDLTFNVKGNIDNSGWYYYFKEITLNYADNSTKTLQLTINAAQNTVNTGINWAAINSETSFISADMNSGSVEFNCKISKGDLGNVTSITVDGKTIELNSTGDSGDNNPVTPQAPEKTPDTEGKITIDGTVKDWINVPAINVENDTDISSMKMAMDTDGNLYVEFEGTAPSEWYGNYQWKQFVIKSGDQTKTMQIANIENKAFFNKAQGNSAAPYYVEFMIPASQLSEPFSVELGGLTVNSIDLPILNGVDATPAEDNTYKGITIDGTFEDWNGVKKTPSICPSEAHPDCLSETAMVFDGDMVYIYIKEGAWRGAYQAGMKSNGRWEITTDLGRHIVFQFNETNTEVSGLPGISAKHVGAEWEIAIPADQLPLYKNTINLGLYGVDADSPAPFITGVANLNGSKGPAGEESPIVIDGSYGDWTNYPSGYYEYAGDGTQVDIIDSLTSITTDGKTMYQYVETEYVRHLGGISGIELTKAIHIRLNNNDNYIIEPRIIDIDDQGNIGWNPTLEGLSPGTYRFGITDTSSWTDNITNIPELEAVGGKFYGYMYLTIGADGKNKCEFSFDLEKAAEHVGIKADDITMVESNFGRLGNQWVATTGASSGPVLGIVLCLLTVAAVYYFNNKKKKTI